MAFYIKTNTLEKGLKEYMRRAGIGKKEGADFRARKAVATQLITWMVMGSPNETVVPPILTGFLRGSGSAFVGSVCVFDTRGLAGGKGTPNKSHSEPGLGVAVGFNTAYAAKLHETTWNPGPRSKDSGNVGNKFVEKHLAADGKHAMELYAAIFKKETGA